MDSNHSNVKGTNMTSIDIYQTLAAKDHNQHYLKRYLKFIQYCEESNKTLNVKTYTEKHHICPKALFPKYKSFKQNPWNMIKLTRKQHLISHHILWKAFGGTQTIAFDYMVKIDNIKLPIKTLAILSGQTSKLLSERLSKPRKPHTQERKDKIAKSVKLNWETSNNQKRRENMSKSHIGKTAWNKGKTKSI